MFAPPHSLFLVASRDGETLGCGGYRPFAADVVELRRMYVRPPARGLGVGRRLLLTLEDAAAEAGAVAMRLETGLRQPQAVRLYERAGYARIPNYDPYEEDKRSLCLEKRLA